MNKVILMGNLTRDVKQFKSESGEVARYTLAVDGANGTDFINCVAFGKAAEWAVRFLAKGKKVLVEGRLSTGKYEKDGETRYTTDVVVSRHYFVERREDGTYVQQGDFFAGMTSDEIATDYAPY